MEALPAWALGVSVRDQRPPRLPSQLRSPPQPYFASFLVRGVAAGTWDLFDSLSREHRLRITDVSAGNVRVVAARSTLLASSRSPC